MSGNTHIKLAIQQYLAEHFPNATTEEWQHEASESINFRVFDGDKTHVLRVMNECLENLKVDAVKPMLENYKVAQVMRDIGDFPIIVTDSGCIFGSP